MVKPSFEECYEQIAAELDKRRAKWQYKLPIIGFDDIKNIIIAHIYKKWHLYDCKKPLVNWVNRIASHQFINLSRNYYTIHLPPCYNCAFNIGENACGYTKSGSQNVQCPIYKGWHDKKKASLDINLPVTVENHIAEIKTIPNTNINYDRSLVNMQDRAKEILTQGEYEVFVLLYIDGKTEADLIKKYNYRQSKNTPKTYNKQLEIIKQRIYEKIKSSLYNDEIDIIFN